jgi:hypothetical protein
LIETNFGVVQNVSQNGILFRILRIMKCDYVEMVFKNTTGEPILINGKVIHCKKIRSGIYEIGIMFLEKEIQDIELINYLLDQHLHTDTVPEVKISGFVIQ